MVAHTRNISKVLTGIQGTKKLAPVNYVICPNIINLVMDRLDHIT